MDDKTKLQFIRLNVILPNKNGQVKNLYNKDYEWLIKQAEKAERYKKTLLKINELYESDDENKLDEYLYGLFTNEIHDDSY